MKWYEDGNKDQGILVASRVRLSRNIQGMHFPWKLTEQESQELNTKFYDKLKGLKAPDGKNYTWLDMKEIPATQKKALKEEGIIGKTLAEKKSPAAAMIAEDHSASISFCGDDHIRIQYMSDGADLASVYLGANSTDDYISERFNYAFDEKYGYLTCFPTNIGTGMRASIIVHLPCLSISRPFRNIVEEVGRFGIKVRGVFGNGLENYGSLYEVFNQKTLGLKEQEIMNTVSRIAYQLAANEKKIRLASLKNRPLIVEDEVYKSYGVLRYARKLSYKEAMTYLSHLRVGIIEGLIKTSQLNIYGMMLEIQPSNLMLRAGRDLSPEEQDAGRASYIRELLAPPNEA